MEPCLARTALLVAGCTDYGTHASPRAGGHTDPFTLQYVAGHDNIEQLRPMFTLGRRGSTALSKLANLRGKHFPGRGERKRRVGAESGAVALPLKGCFGKWLKIRKF